ncbi:hypothetical protein H1S01_00020 [Heliobacterium chlorum]|uniref:YcdB/YcdC repeated domain-containing protein n=1 Tax=Heliobacterium chlorum TaxID=2698 RepID=A0ABR7SY64_HELCL|nr:YcdB/YcdC domain-containing protein [Heliobacterium chlorum]MBC9782892.1 hypothetical protein [Heliobacterium chlorum]
MKFLGTLKIASFVLAANLCFVPLCFADESVNTPPKSQEAVELKNYKVPQNIESKAEKVINSVRKFIPEMNQLNLSYKGVIALPEDYKTHQESTVLAYVFTNKKSATFSEINELGTELGIGLTFDVNTGDLLNIRVLNPSWISKKVPSETVAKSRGSDFLKAIMGDWTKDYRMNNDCSYIDNTISVSFNALYKGVPVQIYGIQISMDAEGHVYDYTNSAMPNTVAFPEPTKAISPKQAEDIYKKSQSMRLVYNTIITYHPNESPTESQPKLLYVPQYDGTIDALTGLPFNLDGNEPIKNPNVTITDKGAPVIVRNKEDAAQQLEKWGIDLLGLEIRKSAIPRQQNNQEIISYTGVPVTENEVTSGRWVNLEVVASSGRVIGFGIQNDKQRNHPFVIPEEEARKKAIQFFTDLKPEKGEFQVTGYIDSQQPDWVDSKKLDTMMEPKYRYDFTLLKDGVPVVFHSYFVEIDGITGKVCGFSNPVSSPAALPNRTGIITPEKAKAEFIKHTSLKLTYFWPRYYNLFAPNPKLVYMLERKEGLVGIDAKTGETVK